MRTTVSIDDELYRKAADELGTHGLSETVNHALAAVVAARRGRAADMLDELDLDLSEDNMRGCWR